MAEFNDRRDAGGGQQRVSKPKNKSVKRQKPGNGDEENEDVFGRVKGSLAEQLAPKNVYGKPVGARKK